MESLGEMREETLERAALAALARGRESPRGVVRRAARVAEDLADARAVVRTAQTSVISLVFFSSAALTLPS
jgi:hypothetical protein